MDESNKTNRDIMVGNNELHICQAEMIKIVQEYLSKRLGSYAPFVHSVKQRDYSFIIELKDNNNAI